MGYIHDTGMSVFISPGSVRAFSGSWTMQGDSISLPVRYQRTAGAGISRLYVPIETPHHNVNTDKGSKIASVDIYYMIEIAALNEVTAQINLITLPTAYNGDFEATISQMAFSYDSGHDTAAERYAMADHVMTLTLTTPTWIPSTQHAQVAMTLDCGTSAVYSFWGMRVNYTLRI